MFGNIFHRSIRGMTIAAICIAYVFALLPQGVPGI